MTGTKLPGYLHDSPRLPSVCSIVRLALRNPVLRGGKRKDHSSLFWHEGQLLISELSTEKVHKQEVYVYFVYPSNK